MSKAKYAGDVIVLGVFIPLFVNIALLILQFDGRGDGSSPFVKYFWIWATFIAWSCGYLWYLIRKKRAWVRIAAPRSIAIGAAVTALLGVANFAYAQVYEPYASPPMVSVTVELGRISTKGKVASMPLRLHTKNTGKVGVYAIGTLYQVSARKSAYKDAPVPQKDWRVTLSDAGNEVFRYGYIRRGGYDLLGQGQFLLPGRKLEPGSEMTSEKVVQFPSNGGYDAISANGAVAYLRKDRATLTMGDDFQWSGQPSWEIPSYRHKIDAPSWVAHKGEDYMRYQSRIVHGSAMSEWTRNTQYVTLWWVLSPPKERSPFGPHLQYAIASMGREGHKPTPAQRQMVSTRYGLNQVSSGTATKSLAELMHR
ncbi:hypothetical protein [Streptomyces albospinus]|nr:hypothetical protein [Streptomyces albospinus]